MASADLNRRLNDAIALIGARRLDEARTILLDLSRTDPNSELVWLWLASSTTDREERIRYLKRVVTINPSNEKARQALVALGSDAASVTTGALPAPQVQPFTRAQIELFGIIIGGLLALFIGFQAVQSVIIPRFFPSPTPTFTATPIPSLTPTPSFTLTASVTFGGPTSTFRNLPSVPTWTYTPTTGVIPTNTPADTDVPLPTETTAPTRTASRTVTPLPTLTPFPTDTPSPASATPQPTGVIVALHTPEPEVAP